MLLVLCNFSLQISKLALRSGTHRLLRLGRQLGMLLVVQGERFLETCGLALGGRVLLFVGDHSRLLPTQFRPSAKIRNHKCREAFRVWFV